MAPGWDSANAFERFWAWSFRAIHPKQMASAPPSSIEVTATSFTRSKFSSLRSSRTGIPTEYIPTQRSSRPRSWTWRLAMSTTSGSCTRRLNLSARAEAIYIDAIPGPITGILTKPLEARIDGSWPPQMMTALAPSLSLRTTLEDPGRCKL